MQKHRGFWWPDHDKDCHPVITNQVKDVDIALKYVKKNDVCIQAGGNVGVFPKYLSERFKLVYTFEPDPANFSCLVRNCERHNIVKFQAALGCQRNLIEVRPPNEAHKNNCGAYQVFNDGYVPTMFIDDLGLPTCDLIYLDVEGFEYFALYGGIETIEKYRPVIVTEEKPLPISYGIEEGAIYDFLKSYGYNEVERIHRDVVYAC